MTGLVDLVNGQKEPVATSGGSGNPLGTIIAVYSNICPIGYLPCNGAAFDINQFPALYILLGDNHTPDLRECTLKMIGESGRAVGAHVKTGGLSVGEFIDDRVQSHYHNAFPVYDSAGGAYPLNPPVTQGNASDYRTSDVQGARVGVTTEVKAVGVNYVIKATSGVMEDAQENFINVMNAERSYSTDEINTGAKWIDGKPIYSKVIVVNSMPNNTTVRYDTNIVGTVGTIVRLSGVQDDHISCFEASWYIAGDGIRTFYDPSNKKVGITTTYDASGSSMHIILEYTKTTD